MKYRYKLQARYGIPKVVYYGLVVHIIYYDHGIATPGWIIVYGFVQ